MTCWLIRELIADKGVHLWMPPGRPRMLEAARHITLTLAAAGHDLPVLIVGSHTTLEELDVACSLGESRSVHIVPGPGASLGEYHTLPRAQFVITVDPMHGWCQLARGGSGARRVYRHFRDAVPS